MRHRFPLLLAAALLAVAAPPVAAKGIESARVCGDGGCAALRDSPELYMLEMGGAAEDPGPARFYEVQVRVAGDAGPGPTFTTAWLPDHGLVHATDPRDVRAWSPVRGAEPRWQRTPGPLGLLLADATDGLAARPADALAVALRRATLAATAAPPGTASTARRGALPPRRVSFAAQPPPADGRAWWLLAPGVLLAVAALTAAGRYETSALNARPRASKSSN